MSGDATVVAVRGLRVGLRQRRGAGRHRADRDGGRDRRGDRGQRRRQIDAARPAWPACAARPRARCRCSAGRRATTRGSGAVTSPSSPPTWYPGSTRRGTPGACPSDPRTRSAAGACGRTSSSYLRPGGPGRRRPARPVVRPAAAAVAGRGAGQAEQAAAARRAGAEPGCRVPAGLAGPAQAAVRGERRNGDHGDARRRFRRGGGRARDPAGGRHDRRGLRGL